MCSFLTKKGNLDCMYCMEKNEKTNPAEKCNYPIVFNVSLMIDDLS